MGLRGVTLRSFLVGGRRATTLEELNRFFQGVTQAAEEGSVASLNTDVESHLTERGLL